MSRLNKLLLSLIIFTIPSNLAWHWYIPEAYLHGRLIDYLLPRWYLSDLFIWGFIGIVLLKNSIKILPTNKLLKFSIILVFFAGLAGVFVAKAPLATLWYLLKIVQMYLLTVSLRSFPRKTLIKTALLPFLLTAVFQSIVGLLQFINQSSLFGYLFLGETYLRSTLNVAKEFIFGRLIVLPYGTTPHPNVLAGFLGFTVVLLTCQNHLKLANVPNLILYYVSIGIVLATTIITYSATVLLALFVIFILRLSRRMFSKNISILLFTLLVASTYILSLLFIKVAYHSNTIFDNQSLRIRYELFTGSLRVFRTHFLFGSGLNNAALSTATITVSDYTLNLQPPHNLLALFIAEWGLFGVGSLTLSLYAIKRRILDLQSGYPFIYLLVIGLFDHFPLTHQTGLILTAFALSLLSFQRNSLKQG